MAIQVFPEFTQPYLSVETVNIEWINDRAVLRSPWSSPKYPGLQNEFLFLKGIFFLSFLFRNCVSLNPLLRLCFKNCFRQRHNAPNYHTSLWKFQNFFWSERKRASYIHKIGWVYLFFELRLQNWHFLSYQTRYRTMKLLKLFISFSSRFFKCFIYLFCLMFLIYAWKDRIETSWLYIHKVYNT